MQITYKFYFFLKLPHWGDNRILPQADREPAMPLPGGLCSFIERRERNRGRAEASLQRQTVLNPGLVSPGRVCHEVPISTERAQRYIRDHSGC
jgi:hypothetical protein